MVKDVLLREVREAFASLAKDHLRPCLKALEVKKAAIPHVQESIIRQLLRLQWRSQDVMSEFAEFHCVRLLLDEQSPLATYFIDLFCQLECLLEELSAACCLMELPLQHIPFPDEKEVLPLLQLVRPVASTCRLLYVAYMVLPKSVEIEDWEEQNKVWRDEVKLSGRHGRRFWRNEMHCRIRELGLTNLDQPGISMIRLTNILGEGAFAKVYKGVFEADDGKSKKIVGRPVAVKMFKRATSNVGSSSNVDWGAGSSSSNVDWANSDGASCDAGGSSSSVDGGGSNSNFGIQSNMDQQPCKLRQELHKLVSVKHPNIVTPIGYIGKRSDQGDGGLVMELMHGSLHDYLEHVKNKHIPPLKELDMLDLMLEIAKGMRFLHECDIMHRDLKPGNVLLRFCAEYGEDLGCQLCEVKLADFGLTKLLYEHFDKGGMVPRHTTDRGTSFYMAPEVRGNLKGEELPFPEKVDVFSFGTTCFNILIGDPEPCAFCKRSDFYEAVRTGKWKEWMQGCIDEQHHYLVKLIGNCWETDPAMRPTFAALCLLLQHAMQCLVSAQSLRNALGAAQAIATSTILSIWSFSEFYCYIFWKKISIFEDPEFYSPLILEYLVQGQDLVIGLKEGRMWLCSFESFIVKMLERKINDKSLNLKKKIDIMVFERQVLERKMVFESQKLERKIDDMVFERQMLEMNPEDMILERKLDAGWKDQDTMWLHKYQILLGKEAVKQILVRGLVCNAYVRNKKNALKESFRDALLLTSTCELMESCLEKPDPLIFMKGLACHNLAERYSLDASARCMNNLAKVLSQGFSPDVGKDLIESYKLPSSITSLNERYIYDFTGDEARSELAVDGSLIPLLVSFWANPY